MLICPSFQACGGRVGEVNTARTCEMGDPCQQHQPRLHEVTFLSTLVLSEHYFIALLLLLFPRTPIVTNAHALAVRNFEAAPEELQAQYSREAFENQATSLDRISEDPMKVTRTICELITDANPPLWNFVGILAAALRFVYYYVPRSWVETVMALGPPSAPVPRPEVLAALQKRA